MAIERNWALLRVEQTAHFRDGFLASIHVDRVWAVYLYDRSRAVHLCELTPSHELRYFDFDFAMRDDAPDESSEHAWGELFDAFNGQELVEYMHIYDVRRLAARGDDQDAHAPDTTAEDLDPKDVARLGPDEALYEAQVEELIEYYSGNPPCWP